MKINVSVKPNSRKGPLVEPQTDGSLIVYIRETPAEGKANEALIKLLSSHYDVAKTKITILRGETNRKKVVQIIDIQP
jgi:uncharacterized protein